MRDVESEVSHEEYGAAITRGAERLCALSDTECSVMQIEFVERMIERGHAPTKGNMLFMVGAPTDEEWQGSVQRMRDWQATIAVHRAESELWAAVDRAERPS